MDLSVVIASRNRAESLDRTLFSISGSVVPRWLRWELIVVDNHSDDDTQDVVGRHIRSCSFPIGVIREKKQGILHARNSGIRASRGRIIAFTDDDVTVDKFWLQNMVSAFDKHGALCVGGKILPVWEAPRPKWLKKNLFWIIALLDYGNNARFMKEPLLWGANLAVASEAFRKYGLFNTRMGRTPNKLYGGEETHFIQKLMATRECVMYTPDAVVYHHIPPERMKKAYFRRWRFDRGEQFGFVPGNYSPKNRRVTSLYILPRLALHSARYLFHAATLSSKAFEYELNLAELIGMTAGRIKYTCRPFSKKNNVKPSMQGSKSR